MIWHVLLARSLIGKLCVEVREELGHCTFLSFMRTAKCSTINIFQERDSLKMCTHTHSNLQWWLVFYLHLPLKQSSANAHIWYSTDVPQIQRAVIECSYFTQAGNKESGQVRAELEEDFFQFRSGVSNLTQRVKKFIKCTAVILESLLFNLNPKNTSANVSLSLNKYIMENIYQVHKTNWKICLNSLP